jgi:hypothetical protein
MGSENIHEYRDNSLLSFIDDSEDYDGVKTTEEISIENDDIIKKKSDTQSISDNVLSNKSTKISPNKVPVTFEWDQGGTSIYLTGNFCNWEQYFLMNKNSNGIYSLTLYLTKGLIQYKFKVDDQWKCNEKYPMMIDNGYKNNFIDTTNWEISVETSEENTKDNTNTNSNTELSMKHKINKSFNSQGEYSNYVPKIKEMNDKAPKIPEPYKHKLNLNKITKQDQIGNELYLSNKEDNLFGENYSYKKVTNLRHEQINHINYKIKNVNNKPIISSLIFRYRLKLTNFVYYK